MAQTKVLNYIKSVLQNVPKDWLGITTHRLDIYEEDKAKVQFLESFENLYKNDISTESALNNLPTAYDYIRLGHPLSCILEWTVAKLFNKNAEEVISFSSETMPILAILRANLFAKKNTQIVYTEKLPDPFKADLLGLVYDYKFELKQVKDASKIETFNGSTVFVSYHENISELKYHTSIDFNINIQHNLGSILLINGKENETYIGDIQHVRRRETIAMTPANTFTTLNKLVGNTSEVKNNFNKAEDKTSVLKEINTITGTQLKPLVGSSGLSIQYAIMMGLVDNALENYKGKNIRFIVPPNCYGGTNDQTRRVAAGLNHVSVVDLPVDAGNDMVKSIDMVLEQIAQEDAVPYIIAEIPTNPRVEVPNLNDLKAVLTKTRKTPSGDTAIDPVFILDQTFCPNVQFLGEEKILSKVRTIAFASGSKFPSGGKCTAGYCVGNNKTEPLMCKIETHLNLCDNEATALQYKILAEQLPSMNARIHKAYKNTNEFVNFIKQELPEAKINFVSQNLVTQGFTPSVFSLDLPTKGHGEHEKETYKRALNLKLINLMITEIPNESKFCVSYGQLKGCYWTIPATSTQGTTKEADKDYIVRVSLSPKVNLDSHKTVFLKFITTNNL